MKSSGKFGPKKLEACFSFEQMSPKIPQLPKKRHSGYMKCVVSVGVSCDDLGFIMVRFAVGMLCLLE